MIELALILFNIIFLAVRYKKRSILRAVVCLHALSILPTEVNGDRSAFLNVDRSDRDIFEAVPNQGNVPKSKLGSFRDVGRTIHLYGSFAKAGAVKGAEGFLQWVPPCDDGDVDMDQTVRSVSLEREWVAVIELPAGSSNTNPSPSHCQTVLDRVRKVMLLGASAIIILAMNPKMVTELDVSQLFPRPIILIQEVENVTALLSALASKIKMKVRLTYNASFYDLQKISTLTMWATCGRSSGIRSYSEFDGVICLGDPNDHVSKADPALFWSYFFSALSFLLLLFMVKAKNGTTDHDKCTQSLQRLTQQAISHIKVKRYEPHASRNYDDSDRDTCAVCLDTFRYKQKIRVMPCFHEFHVGCVDPWLKLHQTCPLCKLNIVDQQLKLGVL